MRPSVGYALTGYTGQVGLHFDRLALLSASLRTDGTLHRETFSPLDSFMLTTPAVGSYRKENVRPSTFHVQARRIRKPMSRD